MLCGAIALWSLPGTEAADGRSRSKTGNTWADMDYGPFLTASIEAPQPATNIAFKGIAIRLADAFGGRNQEAVVFDTDLLRYSAGWTGGFVALKGVVFDGEHWAYPRINGEQIFGNPQTPGWSGTGDFKDPRPFIYGPLPRSLGHWEGLYLHGQQVVLSYTVGGTRVLERPGLTQDDQITAFTRTINLAPSEHVVEVQIAYEADRIHRLLDLRTLAPARPADSAAATIMLLDRPMRDPATASSAPVPAAPTNLIASWEFEPSGGDAASDTVARARLQTVNTEWSEGHAGRALAFRGEGVARLPASCMLDFLSHDLTFSAWIRTARDGTIFAQTLPEGPWVPDGKALFVRGGKLTFDVGWVGAVGGQRTVSDGRWHHVALVWSHTDGAVDLYVDGRRDGTGHLKPRRALDGEVARLGFAASNFPAVSRFEGQMDDVRLYSRRLGEAEVGAEAGPQPEPGVLAAAVAGAPPDARWLTNAAGHLRLQLPASPQASRLTVLLARVAPGELPRFAELTRRSLPPDDLGPLTRGGPPRWPETIATRGQRGPDHGPYAMDTLTWPDDNPWASWMRFGGFDFFSDPTRAAICTWSGDVWLVSGIDQSLERLTWRRYATGLFQPLGLKILEDRIYVLGRDQITRLHDLNGDGEADFYENFNNDAMVTEHFHEFAMDLQSGPDGDLYYMKGARHARDALHPQHGTLIRVSRDGRQSEILANGFRAPNGLEVGPDRRFYTTDQEGYWMPANRLNVIQPGGFHGNTWSWFPGGKPTNYVQPLCWIHPRVDRSPATLAWVTSDRWGPLKDQLLSVSYGVGRIFLVLREEVDGVTQGGVVPLPLEFDTGIMRSRYNAGDGQLYVCGLYGWAGNKTTPGGFYRVRFTGQPVRLPVGLHVATNGLVLQFSVPLDPASALDPGNYGVERWNYRWTENYGSPDFKLNGEKGRDRMAVLSVQASADARTVFLRLADMRPVMQMQVQMNLRCADGAPVQTYVHHSIHAVGSQGGESWLGAAPLTAAQASGLKLESEAPGLIQTLSPVQHRDTSGSDVRRVRLLALHVPNGSPPSPFLPPGPFLCTWEGFLKLDLSETCEFRIEGTGAVTVALNGQVVLPPDSGQASAAVSGPVALRAGLNRLRVEYDSPPQGPSHVRLLWRGTQFGWEPIPPAVLVHDATDPRLADGDARRLGRQLFADFYCLKCHRSPVPLAPEAMPELNADTPSLPDAVARLQPEWLVRYLTNPTIARAEVRMPATLRGDAPAIRSQAADLAAFLQTLPSAEARAHAGRAAAPGRTEDGAEVFQTRGCIACHTLPGEPVLEADTRISLAHVRAKYRPAALADFLRQPGQAFRWTRMPDFQLTEAEADSLAAHLIARGDAPVGGGPEIPGDAARGRALASEAGCANCHALELPLQQPAPPALEHLQGKEWRSGCLAETGDARRSAPAFALSPAQRDALRSFLHRDVETLRRTVWPEFAEQQIKSLRCTACHEREDAKDLWFTLESSAAAQQKAPANAYDDEEAQDRTIHRQRPPLTLAGDKLRAEWLEAFLGGRIPYKPRPKLVARMPAFPAFAPGLARGLVLQHGHPPTSPPLAAIDPAQAQAGEALIRKGSFGCVDCHAVGQQPALAGTDTVTINFAYVPERLQKEYFDRYLMDPQRFLPGTMMPKFVGDDGRTGITTHFQGDPRRQFEAIWHYLRTVPAPPLP